MTRLNRNSPLPDAARPQVADSQIQRAFDTLATPLIEVIKFLTPFRQPEKWTNADFTTGWVDYNVNTTQSRKDALGRVELRGACYRASGALTAMFVLPVNHRPKRAFSFVSISNNLVCRIDVDTTGEVSIGSGGAPGVWVSVSGINFHAES